MIHMAATVGDADEALAHLAAYRTATAGTPGEYATFQALLIEAYVEHSRGAHEACRSLLRRALEIGCRQRYQSWWAWSPTMMTPLLEDALRHDVLPEGGVVAPAPRTPVQAASAGRRLA